MQAASRQMNIDKKKGQQRQVSCTTFQSEPNDLAQQNRNKKLLDAHRKARTEKTTLAITIRFRFNGFTTR